ncbi:hypothetical protein ACFU99_32725 [Streptomyces sp. NPDC057654]|uniref:hypothetical protein n=1 Tax=Streptomyces sp. NPDC057654 TaxID=3346196 RepID=UPI00369D205D
MSTHPVQGWSAPVPPSPPSGKKPHRSWRPHWRIFTWVIIAFNVLMLLWLILGVNAASDEGKNCEAEVGELREACEMGNDVGTAFGAGLIIAIWVAGVFILGVLWLVTNSQVKRHRD